MVKIYLSMLDKDVVPYFLSFMPKSFVKAFKAGEKDYILGEVSFVFSKSKVLEVE